ncbi:MAG: glycerol-3-phosphate dehydrogenase [Burkholderiaceae bacterium]
MQATPDFADSPDDDCDLLVVGGGVNGAGIARDAVGRGLRVVLCEKDDLASHTSSAATKLIHGGLRYLEHYEFSLVRKALAEREVLLRNAPHIIRPLRFVMPHDPSMRPAWMIRAGLFLYDHLSRREVLPGSTTIRLDRHPAGEPLQPRFARGFVYSDGWVDDARLVVLNARDAADRGARILTGTFCERATRGATHWQATLRGPDGQRHALRARALVNAAGPWAAGFLREQAGQAGQRGLRLIKGSHIVVPRLFEHPMAYIFQNTDQRIVFAIPYEQRFTLIGTTDIEVHGDPGAARIDDDEVRYLCKLSNRYFRRIIGPQDVVWSFSGVRPLLDDASGDPSAVTRDYALELDDGAAPLLTVWGGKLTTYRKLAEDAVGMLAPVLDRRAPAWTYRAPLTGGDLAARLGPTAVRRPDEAFAAFERAVIAQYAWLPEPMVRRMAHAYGTQIDAALGRARDPAGLGEAVAPGLYEAELEYLASREWARSGDDVLWRRTKLGLHLEPAQRERVAAWMARRVPGSERGDCDAA